MSGKKKSEVVDVLQSGEAVRARTNASLNRDIEQAINKIIRADEEMQKIKGNTYAGEALNPEAEAMFGAEGKRQAAACQELAKQLARQQINTNVATRAQSKLAAMQRELGECDREAASIRRSLVGKDWYCDEEYRRAKELKKSYERLAAERKSLAQEVAELGITSSAQVHEARARYEEWQKACAAVAAMNTTAQNKKAADALRKQLKTIWADIPSDWAQKFAGREYAALGKDVNTMCGQSDVTVIQGAPDLLSKMNAFQSKLVARIATWKQQKADAEAMREQAEAPLAHVFIDPMDHYEEECDENYKAPQIKLFDYLHKYIKTDYEANYKKAFTRAQQCYAAEDFVQAHKYYDEARILAGQANVKALELQENLLKKMELAAGIRDVMEDLRYEVETEIINDNPNDGFRIRCTCGDEIIDFTEVSYDAEGNPVVNIDHTESRTGTCGSSWRAIAQKMREQGIPLTDVKKNGQSVLTPNQAPKVRNEKNPGQQQRS